MTISAWRIVKARFAAGAFSGDGARTYGGRWNSPGAPVVYVAGSTSLAMLEMLVHVQSEELMKRYVIFEVTFDDKLVTELDTKTLPRNWRRWPSPAAVQRIGDDWVAEGTSAVLRVPSVIVPTEWNYLLNPAHPGFADVTIGPRQPVRFDPRLMRTPLS